MRFHLIGGISLIASIAASQMGCAADRPSTDSSESDAVSATSGLWVLDGEAEVGDLELLQLTGRGFAALLRDEAEVIPPPGPNTSAAFDTASGPHPSTTASSATTEVTAEPVAGRVTRASSSPEQAPSLSLAVVQDDEATNYKITSTPDTLTLTAPDGRQLHYRRSYQLYCVPDDPGTEATMLIEMTKTPKVVGVNGDGHRFPTAGDYVAQVRTDKLFDEENYVLESTATNGSSIKVTFPWGDMTKAQLHGTIAITGTTANTPQTKISCERITPPPAPPPPSAPTQQAPQR